MFFHIFYKKICTKGTISEMSRFLYIDITHFSNNKQIEKDEKDKSF